MFTLLPSYQTENKLVTKLEYIPRIMHIVFCCVYGLVLVQLTTMVNP